MKNFKRITKRGLSLFIALVMCMSVMSVTASAAGAVSITNVSVQGASNTQDSGNFVMTIPGEKLVSSCTLLLRADQAFNFIKTENPADGELYVKEAGENAATLHFNVAYRDANMNSEEFAMTLTSANGTVWTGKFGSFENMTLNMLAAALRTQGASLQVAAGVMDGTSQARRLLVNEDTQNVTLILCVPDATVYEVTYDVPDGDTIVWSLVSGMNFLKPVVASSTQSVTWYTDEARTIPLSDDAKVTGNTTIYAKIESTSEDEDFLKQLISETGTATIKDTTDWETFATHSAEAPKGKLVILAADIDCGGKSYPALTFNGSFNGYDGTTVHKISNAKFTKVDSNYVASSETGISSCGMFNRIIDGQTVANLILEDITTQDYNATYSAPLAGIVDGTYNNKARIQNVQVINCKSQGRTAGGVIGFLRNGTIEFCSSSKSGNGSAAVNGLANGAGIVGINSAGNALVINCYCAGITPTALTFMGKASVGGVVGKNLRGAKAEACWSTYVNPVGLNESPSTETNCYGGVTATSGTSFTGFDSTYWNTDKAEPDFIPSEVLYTGFNTVS